MKHTTVLKAVEGYKVQTSRDANRTYYRVNVGASVLIWSKHDSEDNAEGITFGDCTVRTTGTLSQVLKKYIV